MSFEQFTAKDYALDSTGDLLIENGDLVLVPSDEKHISDILCASKGNWRFAPLVGVDVASFVNSVGATGALKRRIQSQLEYDGYQIKSIKIEANGSFLIDANRIR